MPSRQRHQYLQARKGSARRATLRPSDKTLLCPGKNIPWPTGRRQSRGVKFLHPITWRSIGKLAPPISVFAKARALYGRALLSVCCCSKDSFTTLAGSSFSFACPPTIHKVENKNWKCRTVRYSSIKVSRNLAWSAWSQSVVKSAP